jgi:hypothetical protein
MVAAVVHEIANRRMRGGRREHKWAEQLLSKAGEDWDADKGSYRALQSNYKETLKQIAHKYAKMVAAQLSVEDSSLWVWLLVPHEQTREGSRRNSLRRHSRLALEIARYRTFKSRIVRVRSIP